MKCVILLLAAAAVYIAAASCPVFAMTYAVAQDASGNFTSVQACANAAGAGDTCLVYPGEYDERVTVRNNGSEGSRITFMGSGRPKIKAFTVTGREYITIQGFEITHLGFMFEPYAGSTGTASIYLRSSRKIQILDNYIHDTEGTCILFYGLSPSAASHDVWIKGNTIGHCAHVNLTGGGSGIYVFGNNNLVENNDISHNGNDFMLCTGGSRNVFRNNILHDNSVADRADGQDPHIDGLQNWCSTGSIATNYLLIENNTLFNANDTNSHFIIFQDMGDCGSSDIIARHNNVKNLGSAFIINDDSVRNVRLYHNTAVDLEIALNPKGWTSVAFSRNSTGGKAINNIYYNTVRNYGNENYADNSSSAGFYADYNLGYNSECQATCVWNNPRPGIGQEPHSILNRDPLFRDVAGDFSLKSGSPAIDAGGALTKVSASDSGTGTTLNVEDAGFFQDGWAGAEADWIAVGNTGNTARIVSIDYALNSITLANPVTRRPGDSVWLYSDSDESRVLYGSAPDIGAHEYVSPGTAHSCGNSVTEPGEACDESDLNNNTCASLPGFRSGTLACKVDCKGYDVSGCVKGGVVDAASCSQADVQTAVNAAQDGDKVRVPAGNCTWTVPSGCNNEPLTCAPIKIIRKSVVLEGAGIDKTNITCILPPDWYFNVMIFSNEGRPARVTGFTITGSQRPTIYLENVRNFRVDHCKFISGARSVATRGTSRGVIDHCAFINSDIGVGIGGDNDASWMRPIAPGTSDAVFVEDSVFLANGNGSGADCGALDEQIYHESWGARSAIRHNTFNGSACKADFVPVEAHGNWPNPPNNARGIVMTEVYNNMFHAYKTYRFMHFRGGSVLAFNNNMLYDYGSRPAAIGLTDENDWQTAFFNPLDTTWPAQDQIFNSFFWNNTMNGQPVTASDIRLWNEKDAPFIQQGRDYWMQEPQAVGGRTEWIDPARPGADDNEIFVDGPNAYFPYALFTYPHPLAQLDGANYHRADTDQNMCVEISELLSFIAKWKINNQDVSLIEIIDAIGMWKRGC